MKKLITIILVSFAIEANAQSSTDLLFIKKINEFRAQNGLTTLTYNAVLDSAAEWHSAYMAKTGVCGHGENQYYEPQNRIEKYDPQAFTGKFDRYEVGENACLFNEYCPVLTDQAIVDKAFTLWLNSPGHKAAMLDKTAQYIGFGDVITTKHREPFPDTFYTGWCTMVTATKPITRVITD